MPGGEGGTGAGATDTEPRHAGAARASSRWQLLSWPKKILSGLLATAVAVSTLWGGVSAARQATDWFADRRDRSEPTELTVTPRLGLQIWQDGVQSKMFVDDLLEGSQPVVRIPLDARPFEIVFPQRQDEVDMAVAAWDDETIFDLVPGTSTDETPFGLGRGIADYEFGGATLYLNTEGSLWLSGERVVPLTETRSAARFSSTWSGGTSTPILQRRGPLYLVCFRDRDRDGIVDVGEYEYLRLDL
jgi:hypothetical protein